MSPCCGRIGLRSHVSQRSFETAAARAKVPIIFSGFDCTTSDISPKDMDQFCDALNVLGGVRAPRLGAQET